MITIKQNSKIIRSAVFETLDSGIQKLLINTSSKEVQLLTTSSCSNGDKGFDFTDDPDYGEMSEVVVTGVDKDSFMYESHCKDQFCFIFVPIDLLKGSRNSEVVTV